jgi:hypothetical protein
MLRYKDKIRLTPKERAAFAALPVEGLPTPTTVAEYNAALESAADIWATGDSAEEQLAALLARDQTLPDSTLATSDEGAAVELSTQSLNGPTDDQGGE